MLVKFNVKTSSTCWLGRTGNMWIYLGDVIDENRFHNCVGESEKAPLVPLSRKGMTDSKLYVLMLLRNRGRTKCQKCFVVPFCKTECFDYILES